jgi:hypothetical protein
MFTSFLGWVEATRGIVAADSLLVETQATLSTDGAYTSVGDYPDSEFTALVDRLAAMEERDSDEIMREFGVAAFPQLGALHPEWLDNVGDLFQLLSGIEVVIHTQVRRLYPDSQPPLITATQDADGVIDVIYVSRRGLIPFCQGLIEGAAQHFDDACEVRVTSVVREGDTTRASFQVRPINRG